MPDPESDRTPDPETGPAEEKPAGLRTKAVRRLRRISARIPRIPGWRRWTRRILYAVIGVALVALAGLAGLAGYTATTIPDYDQMTRTATKTRVTLTDVHGQTITVHGLTHGDTVTLAELPAHVPKALIAAEDQRFYRHFGVDPIALMRAIYRNVRAGRVVSGGSTLTQQLAKNLFLTPDRTLARKAHELVLALALEAKFTKDQILALYLNRVYFGAGTYGIDAAARRYFGKPATELDLGEAAMLAGLVQAPSRLAPTTNFEGASDRARLVLNAMAREGYISRDERDRVTGASLNIAAKSATPASGYFTDWVLDEVFKLVGRGHKELVVRTTLDLDLQRAAETALKTALEKGKALNVSEGAIVALDTTGAVRTMVGGKSYAQSQFNRAVGALRQPGSAFKPFVYLTAVEMGYGRRSRWWDAPVRIGNWSPKNFAKGHAGLVSMQEAFARSLNTVAVRVSESVGRSNVISTARRLGISSAMRPDPSMALGAFEVTPLELAAAYTPFANGGSPVRIHGVISITTKRGKQLYERERSSAAEVIRPRDLLEMNRMMRHNIETGTGRGASLERPAGGKTGTSTDFRDAWFAGYTSELVTVVWVGNDDNSPMKKVTGGSLPAQIWRSFMVRAHRGHTIASLPPTMEALDRDYEEDEDGFLFGLFGSPRDGRRGWYMRDGSRYENGGAYLNDPQYGGLPDDAYPEEPGDVYDDRDYWDDGGEILPGEPDDSFTEEEAGEPDLEQDGGRDADAYDDPDDPYPDEPLEPADDEFGDGPSDAPLADEAMDGEEGDG